MAMNFVDVDGHVLEPSDLWTTRVDARYRDRALQLLEDDEGLEYWSVGGEAIPYFAGGTSADAATIGKSEQWRLEHIYEKRSLTWQDGLDLNPGACDPDERVKLMDREGSISAFSTPLWGSCCLGYRIRSSPRRIAGRTTTG